METISACPHHGFDTWMLVNHFYGGMSPAMKQLLETMCGGDFLSKHPDEAMDFLNYVAETSKGWDEPNPREVEKMRPSPHQRGGIFALSEETEMKEKLITLTRRLEELEMRNQHEVQAVMALHSCLVVLYISTLISIKHIICIFSKTTFWHIFNGQCNKQYRC